MPATVFFQNSGGNDIATLQMTFQVSGVPTDPTVATCIVTDPTGVSVTHTVGAGPSPADIVHTGTGIFTLNVGSTIVGLWGFEWIGTGVASDVQPGTWTVHPAQTINQFYTSVEEIKDRLGITDTASDFQLQVAVQAAGQAINHMTGRHFFQVAETRTYMPYSIYDLPIDDLVSLTQMNVDYDGDGIFETAWTAGTDYELAFSQWEFMQNVTGEPRPYMWIRAINAAGGGKFFPFTWPFSRLDRIQLIGVWGWPSVPSMIKEASMQIASEFFKLKDSPFGLAGSSEFGVVRLPRQNPYVVKLVSPYIHPRRKVGV